MSDTCSVRHPVSYPQCQALPVSGLPVSGTYIGRHLHCQTPTVSDTLCHTQCQAPTVSGSYSIRHLQCQTPSVRHLQCQTPSVRYLQCQTPRTRNLGCQAPRVSGTQTIRHLQCPAPIVLTYSVRYLQCQAPTVSGNYSVRHPLMGDPFFLFPFVAFAVPVFTVSPSMFLFSRKRRDVPFWGPVHQGRVLNTFPVKIAAKSQLNSRKFETLAISR